MAKSKKDYPIDLLKTIEPFFKSNDKYNIVTDTTGIIRFEDKESSSSFYFEVKSMRTENGKTSTTVAYKPKNKTTTAEHTVAIELSALPNYISGWIDRLTDYDGIDIDFEDPIIKSNQAKFFEKFKILDEDANTSSFDLEQQLFLEEYLNSSIHKLQSLQNGKDGAQLDEIKDLENEAEEILLKITRETKQQIIQRLTKFWGKAQKTGLEVIKQVLIDVASEIAKKLLLGP